MKPTTKKTRALRTLQVNELRQVAGGVVGYGLNNGFDQEGTSAGYRGSWVEKR